MIRLRLIFLLSLALLGLAATACGSPENTPIPQPGPNAPAPILPTGAPGTVVAANPAATPVSTSTPPKPEKNYCPGGGVMTAGPNDKLAAKVNGDGIPLALFDRQTAQAQAAFIAQGMDPKTQQGQESMKAVREQVLDQLIGDVLIEQAAKKAGVQVSENDVNARIQGLINDAGGNAKFDEYLKSNQLLLSDLCVQIRAQVFGEIMLDRVTAALPTKAEQVHAAHILFATAEDANKVIPLVKQGQDFGALAKQYSQDTATKDNGGDLGWFPRGVMDAQFEAIAFQLPPGQVSDLVTTQFGFHLIKVLEKDPARALPPELLQTQRQQAFLDWLEEQRKAATVEKLI